MKLETLLMNDLQSLQLVALDASDAAWRHEDIEWFAARPNRSYRLRRALEGDPMKAVCNFVLVKQSAPGIWVCAPAYRSGSKINKATLAELSEASDAGDCPAYFDLALQLIWRDLQTRKFRPLGVVYAQAKTMRAISSTARQ